MKRTFFICLCAFFLFFSGKEISAQVFPGDEYPESVSVRTQIRSLWLEGEVDSVLRMREREYTDRYVNTFTVAQKKDTEAGLLEIAVSPSGLSGFQGAWILYRRLSDGMPDHIKIYPFPDKDRFLTLRPDTDNPEKGKSVIDVTVFGAFLCRDIPVGISFTALYTAPLSSIVQLTAKTVPWELLSPDPDDYRNTVSAVSVIRERIASLVYVDDGAFDEQGRPVHIEDGTLQTPDEILAAITPAQKMSQIVGGVNCSGFAKWVIDGIIRVRAGTGLYIEPLKQETGTPQNKFVDPWKEQRDLYFGLDWTRNLASAVLSMELKRTVKPESSGVDVTSEYLVGTGVYQKNIGYPVTELKPVLYALALKESGMFYLGAVSTERGNPPLRQFHHVAVLFPYFDENGDFQVAVFESARESASDAFISTYRDSWIHLVRVRLPEAGYFNP